MSAGFARVQAAIPGEGIKRCFSATGRKKGAWGEGLRLKMAFKNGEHFCRAGGRARSNEATAYLQAQPVKSY